MELHVHDSVLRTLESALVGLDGARRARPLVEICWHLRQRDTRRADALCEEARALLESHAPAAGLPARLALTRAECALLLGRTTHAESALAEARRLFAEVGDDTGTGDTAAAEARLAESRGDRPAELAAHAEALAAYRRAKDHERVGHGRCAALLANGFGDPAALAAELHAIRAETPSPSPALALHLRFIEGVAAFQRGAFLDAVPALTAVAAGSYDWGLCDQGFRAEAGLVSAQSNLGDRESSCAMAETALARARALGWPRVIGHALANFARQLAETGEPQRAVDLLLEAREVLSDQPRSRGFAIASYYLGDALLALGRHAEALEHLELAERLMRDLGAQPEVACLLAIQGQALTRLDRPEEGLARAHAALELARQTGSRLWEVEALRSLAEIHTGHAARVGGGADRAQSLLREALAVVETIGGHHEKSQLYAEIARAHEAAGDLAGALAAERAARAEEVRESNRRAGNRLLLARERHETERQSERARALEGALATLEHLRQVGQDITAHLDPAGMLQALDRHLARLADVTLIGVFVFDAAGGRLTRHGIERGRVLAVRDVPLADFESYAARAARERREIHVDAEEGGRPATRIPGTEVTRSLWFGPLLRGDQLLGVLTVQSGRVRAFGEREKLIFRTIAGYVAVAFANARIHGELEEKHRRLAETEAEMRKLATTDPLTGLDNRRRFFASGESEVARAVRYGGPVGFAMADLDRFKSVNDEGGHGAGDRVIAAVSQALRAQQRPHDVIGRLGGEEFAFVFPGADLEATWRAAERIRETIEALEVEYGGQRFHVTVSFGCAAIGEARGMEESPAALLEALLRDADAALYEAKRLGRNRVQRATGAAARAVPQARS
jgi:diguanylate cyclase (GGDEF)-like protein